MKIKLMFVLSWIIGSWVMVGFYGLSYKYSVVLAFVVFAIWHFYNNSKKLPFNNKVQ